MRGLSVCVVLLGIGLAGGVQATPDAGPGERAELIRELMRAQGLEQMLLQQERTAAVQARQVALQTSQRLVSGRPQLAVIDSAVLSEAIERYVVSASTIDIPATVAKWGQLYAAQLTDGELRAILAYYRSPVGRKDLAAAHAAIGPFTVFVQRQLQQRLEGALPAYLAELESIVGAPTLGAASHAP